MSSKGQNYFDRKPLSCYYLYNFLKHKKMWKITTSFEKIDIQIFKWWTPNFEIKITNVHSLENKFLRSYVTECNIIREVKINLPKYTIYVFTKTFHFYPLTKTETVIKLVRGFEEHICFSHMHTNRGSTSNCFYEYILLNPSRNKTVYLIEMYNLKFVVFYWKCVGWWFQYRVGLK